MSALPRRNLGATVVATLSLLIAIGLPSGVAVLFLRDSVPFEQELIAERATRDAVSEREACTRAFAGAPDRRTLASR